MSVLSFSRRSMSTSNAKVPAPPQILTFLYPSSSNKAWSRGFNPRSAFSHQKRKTHALSLQYANSLLIGALVAAGTCNQHGLRSPVCSDGWKLLSPFHKASSKLSRSSRARVQLLHTPSNCNEALTLLQDLNRDDYIAMLDYYGERRYAQESIPVLNPVHIREPVIANADGNSKPLLSPVKQTVALTWKQQQAIEKLKLAIKDWSISNAELYQFYQAIPYPGVLHLDNRQRRRLLRRLSITERRSETAMLQYLSVLDDMKAANLPLTASEWSSAIHLAGRSLSRVTAVEVEAALRLWKEMEQEAGVEGSSVTFNILFDIAIKAGKFALAEMILEEMRARKLDPRRFSYVSLIYYYGLREDGDGIRNTYRDLIDAGQVVDTTVLNCVVASLLRAGEPFAAEQVYERMKIMYTRRTGLSTSGNSKNSRELGRVLDRAVLNKNPEALRVLQDKQSLAPDEHTYVVLITHHVSHTGELQRIASYLDDMQVIGLRLSGRLYMEVFRGFATHGGVRLSFWTSSRLESVWVALQTALSNDHPDIYIAKWLAIWIVKAFARCCGRKRTTEIWNELKCRWKPTDEDRAVISAIMTKALEHH